MEEYLFNIYIGELDNIEHHLYAVTFDYLELLYRTKNQSTNITLDGYKAVVEDIYAFKVYTIELIELPESWRDLTPKMLENVMKIFVRESKPRFVPDLFNQWGFDVSKEFESWNWKSMGLNTKEPQHIEPTDAKNGSNGKPIFISHAYKDKKIVDQFVDEVLERGLGIDAHLDVYYTSSPVTGIGAGADWREDIRQGVVGAAVVICFISENYTASQYCIAELGAAWAFGKTIIPIAIPPKSDMKGGELYAHLQVIDGNDRLALNRLKDDLINLHQVGRRIDSSAKWEKALGKYLDAIATTKAGIEEAGKK